MYLCRNLFSLQIREFRLVSSFSKTLGGKIFWAKIAEVRVNFR